MREEEIRSFQMQAAFGLAATEHAKIDALESKIISLLENGNEIDSDTLTDYGKVTNSYCDALDLIGNYNTEQEQYEKAISLFSRYSVQHSDQFNIIMIIFIKYASVLMQQKKFKKSCRVLQQALSFLFSNMENIEINQIDTILLTKQISQL